MTAAALAVAVAAATAVSGKPGDAHAEASVAAAASCRLPAGLRLPNPFSAAAIEHLFDPEGVGAYPWLHKLDTEKTAGVFADHARRVEACAHDCACASAYLRLLQDGMEVIPWGMDLTPVFSKRLRRGELPSLFLDDPDVRHLRRTYYATRLHERVFWEPMPERYSWQAWSSLQGFSGLDLQIQQFRRDGFLRLDSWCQRDGDGLGDPDPVCDLQPDLRRQESVPWTTPCVDMEALVSGMLREGSLLRELVDAYLGPGARFNGVEPLSLEPLKGTAARKAYDNAAFHHDGCGQRVKAFYYCHDVGDRGRPTVVAAGTHRTQWFPTTHYFVGQFAFNKLNHSAVQRHFAPRMHRMTAPVGGGYIFDSDTMHGALTHAQNSGRRVIIMEFVSARHWQSMAEVAVLSDEDGRMSCLPDGMCHGNGYLARWL